MNSSDTSVTFSVDDTSPCVSYVPLGDTFSTPNLVAGWNPYFDPSGFVKSQGDGGQGTSLHVTSLDGAAFAIQWNGTGIKLLGNATQASYTVSIDNNPLSDAETLNSDLNNNVLANIRNLPAAQHTLRLTAVIPQDMSPSNPSMLVFDQAILTSASSSSPANESIASNAQMLAAQKFVFRGLWSITSNIASTFTQFTSTNKGDIATIAFNGSTLLMHGGSSPQSGTYSVALDGANPIPFSARASFAQTNALLFYASNLDPKSIHSVTVMNTAQGHPKTLSLLLDGFDDDVVNPTQSPPGNTPNETASPSPASTGSERHGSRGRRIHSAALIAGGIVGVILLSAVLITCVLLLKRHNRRRKRVYLENMERRMGDGMG